MMKVVLALQDPCAAGAVLHQFRINFNSDLNICSYDYETQQYTGMFVPNISTDIWDPEGK